MENKNVLHTCSSTNTHSAPEKLNLAAGAVEQLDGGLRGEAASVPVHKPADT